jgi:hypothetical protein
MFDGGEVAVIGRPRVNAVEDKSMAPGCLLSNQRGGANISFVSIEVLIVVIGEIKQMTYL